jgi:hypothetical protein
MNPLIGKSICYTHLDVFAGIPYLLDPFQTFLNVFIIH